MHRLVLRPFCLGRDNELQRLEALLKSSSLVTVVAPGGMGKTRLTETFAADRGVVFVPLADIEAPIEEAIAARLGVALDRVLAVLLNADPPCLVLDNVEHRLDDVRAWLEGVFGAVPDLRCVATSRVPLDFPGEAVLQLGPLEADHAMALMAQCAEHHGVTLTDPETQSLVVALGGVPLALELGAARLRTHTPQSLSDAASPLRLLASPGGGLPARHQRLESVLEETFEALPAAVQNAAMRMSLWVDTFHANDAETLLGDITWLDALLASAWVGTVAPRHFRMPRLLQVYAREQLARDPEAFSAGLIALAQQLVGEVGPLRRCPPHTLETLFWLAHQPLPADLRTRVALGLEFPVRLRFAYERWDRLLGQVQEALDADQADLLARLLDARNLAAMANSHTEEAHGFVRAALSLYPDQDRMDPSLRASLLISLGMIASERGELQEGIAYLDEALVYAQSAGDVASQIRARQKRTMPRYVLGDVAGALEDASAASRLAEQHNDAYELGRSLSVEAVIRAGNGEFARARQALLACLRTQERIADADSLVLTHTNLGNLDLIEQRLQDARGNFDRALRLSQETGNLVAEAIALEGLAAVELEAGRPAVNTLEAAASLMTGLEAPYEQLEIQASLVVHHLCMGQRRAARHALEHAWSIATPLGIAAWTQCLTTYQALLDALDGRDIAQDAIAGLDDAGLRCVWMAALEDARDAIRPPRLEMTELAAWSRLLDREPWRRPPAWVAHNPLKVLERRMAPPLTAARVLLLRRDGREVTTPDGTTHDFTRRGPLRLIVLELADRAEDGNVMSVDDVVAAGWPDEKILPDAARLRVYTTIKRLRNLGFADLLETTDAGYRLDPGVQVRWAD